MKKLFITLFSIMLSLTVLQSPAFGADCSVTECACVLVTYHDPGAPVGQDIVTEKSDWQKAPGLLNRRLGKWEMILFQWSYQSNGVQACCSIIDNDSAQSPWAGLSINHFLPLNGDRRGMNILQYAQTPEYAEWTIVTDGDLTNPVEIPSNTVIDSSLIDNLLMAGESRLIPITDDQSLIDEARLLLASNRADLLNGC